VFWLYAVYTIGLFVRILILLKHDKWTGGSAHFGADGSSFINKKQKAEVTGGATSLAGIDRRG
jgi:preprotein translocase subunit SecG